MYVYLWLIMLRFDRKQQNSVKQLSFNKKKNKQTKKKLPSYFIDEEEKPRKIVQYLTF